MRASPLKKLRLPFLFAVVLGVAYAVASSAEGAPEGEAVAAPHLRWLLAAFLGALGVLGVQIVRLLVLDVAFFRTQGHRAPALVHAAVSLVLYIGLALLIAGGVFDRSLTGALATSAVASVVLGLALQETLGNLFAGLALQVERPFRPGDVIRSNGLEGRVESFNWRATTIQTVDDTRIAIPNGVVAREPLEVFARDELNRRRLVIPAPYEVAPQRVIGLVREAVTAVPDVSDRKPPQIRVGSFDDSSVGYEVLYWVEDYMRAATFDAQVRERVWYVFARNGVPIPFPHQVQVSYTAPPAAPVGEGAWSGEAPQEPTQERERLLGAVRLFEPLTPEERRRLATRARAVLFAPGEQILACGDEGSSMFVVVRGRVEIRASKPDGRRVRVAEIRTGEVFGEMSLLTGAARSADVWAVDEVELIEVGKPAMGEVLASNGALAEALSRQVSRRLNERTEAFAQADVEEPRQAAQESLLQKIQQFFDLR